jgi:hypothetical protein
MILFNETFYKSIGFKEDISFVLDGSINIPTGFSSFGISGDDGRKELFSFKDGKIFDLNNQYVYSYNPDENFLISGNFGSGYINYYINNTLICLFNQFENNSYKYFYANSSNALFEFEINIKSNNGPKYEINFSEPISLGANITGTIKNTDPNPKSQLQIFSGSFINQELYSLTNLDYNFISGGQEKRILLSYTSLIDPSIFFQSEDVIRRISGLLFLKTNFGNLFDNVSLIVREPGLYLLDFREIFSFFEDLGINSVYTYSYGLLTKSTEFPRNVSLTIENYSGHGNEILSGEFLLTGNLEGTLSNFIYGFDYITGNVSGNLISTRPDFFGNFISTGESIFVKSPTTANYVTGDVEYLYRIKLTGGSGFASAPVGTTTSGYGEVEFNNNIFIFKTKTVGEFGSGFLTGDWQNIPQSGFFESVYLEANVVFTGDFNLDYRNLIWSGLPSITEFGEEFNNNLSFKKFYGITGLEKFTFSGQDNGIKNLNSNININKSFSGFFLKDLFVFNNFEEYSRSGYSDSNVENVEFLFYRNPFIPEVIFSQTGYIEFHFTGFNSIDKLPITHYELGIDLENSDYEPYALRLLGKNNINDNFTSLDYRTGENFYSSIIVSQSLPPTFNKIFQIENTGFFNFLRLEISGRPYTYKNIETTNVIVNALKFYTIYPSSNNNLGPIFNNVNNNTFIISENNINYTGTVTAPNQQLLNSSELAWNAFNLNSNFAKIYNLSTGLFLNIKNPKPLDRRISGFYIKYPIGYRPYNVSISGSKDNINYVNIYNNTGNLLNINSGFLNLETGFQFFNYNFNYETECIDLNLSNNPLSPTFFPMGNSSLFICGSINNTFSNYFHFNLQSSVLASLYLTNYNDQNINSSFFIKSGSVYSPILPIITSGNLNNSKLNINLISGVILDIGNYVIEIKTTGLNTVNYKLGFGVTNLNNCNLIVENAGFDIFGNNLNGNYILSNNYNSNRSWNNYPYYENILLGKNGSIWWDTNSGWLLGGGSELSTNPSNYEYIYASGGFSSYPFSNSVWSPIQNRPSPLIGSFCVEETLLPNTPNQPTVTNLTDNGCTVNWNLVSNFSVYYLDIATDNSFFNIIINNLRANGSSKQISSLAPSTQYYVRVRAENNVGTSSNSVARAFTTQIARPEAPNQPTSTNVITTSFTANWNSVTNATSYRIDVSTNSSFSSFVGGFNNLTVNGTSQAITGLTANTTYYVRVRAVNAGGSSTPSPTLIQTTLSLAPAAPSQPTTAGFITDVNFTVNWVAVNGATSYRIDVSTNSSFSSFVQGFNNLTVNGTSQAITGLTANTTYYVRVRAVNSSGTSAPSPTLIQPTAFGQPQFEYARTQLQIQVNITVPLAYRSSNHGYFLELSPVLDFSSLVFDPVIDYAVGGPSSFTQIFNVTNQTYYFRSRTYGPIQSGLSTYSPTITIPPVP